ncbi:MAG: diaminopimelate decarboxylase, partial [Muribaculaceae bacterium]|nr:diaminopimelate decarboxylase [Muribaculaceae bacterium]
MLDIDISEAGRRETPFYFYDLVLLDTTVRNALEAASVNPKFRLHYAVKACTDPRVLRQISNAGLGADTVSGGEILRAVETGFPASKIMFAGVGKTDREIDTALDQGIEAFNVESIPELENISERAAKKGVTANVAIRVNPEIDAHTHHYITTGLAENKFGINLSSLDKAIDTTRSLPAVRLIGLHFHIGSQITITEPFKILAERVNSIVRDLAAKGIRLKSINVGGGLGIDYDNPDENPVPDFKSYFDTFNRFLDTSLVDEVHFELGRALVGQCGSLISKVLYVKEGDERTFAILDAGMSELIRPALYQALHAIQNISGNGR